MKSLMLGSNGQESWTRALPKVSCFICFVDMPQEVSKLNLGKKISIPRDVMLEELSLLTNKGSKMFKLRQLRVEKFIYENNPDAFTDNSVVGWKLKLLHTPRGNRNRKCPSSSLSERMCMGEGGSTGKGVRKKKYIYMDTQVLFLLAAALFSFGKYFGITQKHEKSQY